MSYENLNYKGTRKLPEVFTEGEINQIMQQILNSNYYYNTPKYKIWGDFLKWRDICLIATLYLLALRPNEACSLKFEDFNFRNGMVKIKGDSNKCKKDRVIPYPKVLMNFYKNYLEFDRLRFWQGSPYLFPGLGKEHITAERLKTIFREKVLKPMGKWEAPINGKVPKFRAYTLRHSRASQILNKQIKETGRPDIYAIANFLGHADIRHTTVYLHTDKAYNEYLREQIEI